MITLLCNDDGIHADGLRHLRSAAAQISEPVIVAPSEERSAVGHAITDFDPIKVHEETHNGEFYGFAVHGTPADSVKLGVEQLMPAPPDLVLSGINLGPNTGISVLYSGTVSAASEAALLGLPSIAFSLCTYQDPHWETAAAVAGRLLQQLDGNDLKPGTVLNVNIPNVPFEELRGVQWVRVARSRWVEEFEERTSPRGDRYYWLGGVMRLLDDKEDNDVTAVEQGYVSITPLELDMTHYTALGQLSSKEITL